MIVRLCMLGILLLANFAGKAQERVKIQDPELSFSYILPQGWSNYDDDLFHYILNPDTSIQISLTYYEGMCKELDDCYLGEVQGKLRSEYSGFKVLEEAEGSISEVPARWAKCSGARDGELYTIVAYYLVWRNQFFKVVAYLPENAALEALEQTERTVLSLVLKRR